MNDDTPRCERHEANYIQSEGYQNRNSHDSYFHQSHHDPNDSEKSLTELNNDVKNDLNHFKSFTNIFFKNNVNDMILKMKQNEKNFQIEFKNMERKIDEWEKSQNVSLEQIDRNEPPPPPQAHTEQVKAILTGSGKSNDPPKIQKDPPPPIIVNNKIEKDKPIKTTKRGYHVVKSKEYQFHGTLDNHYETAVRSRSRDIGSCFNPSKCSWEILVKSPSFALGIGINLVTLLEYDLY
ncbi:hypothetical protein Tco_0617099 [Tanacetum coccineum]